MNLLKNTKNLSKEFKLRIKEYISVLLMLEIKPGARIAIGLPRGQEAAAAIYAVLSIGATYVPLDMTNPDSRLKDILLDAQVALVIITGTKQSWCSEGINWLAAESISDACKVDSEPHEIYESGASELAAILYTSGSSGTPKGVALSHGAMSAFADWAGEVFSVTNRDRIGSLAPFYFDLSVFDLFTSLRFGASVHFMPNSLTLSPVEMANWLEENKITLWYTVPTVLTFLTLKGDLSKERLPNLRKVLFAGEVFPTTHLLKLSQLLPHVEFYNLFGPTETNVCCYWAVDRKIIEGLANIPIGYPACNDEICIDSTGELLVRGPSLMSGYFSKGTLSYPFDENGWYRTGDCVSVGPDGEFYYHGRLDRQLKCHGFRIEPGEVEKALYNFPGVEECAVFGIENRSNTSLVACVGSLNVIPLIDLVKYLKNHLPSYMIPERVEQMRMLPRLSNGKLDSQKLKEFFKN